MSSNKHGWQAKLRQIACLGILVASFFCGSALGCSCGVPPPPCYRYWRTDRVFVGTVSKISQAEGSPWDRVEISVDEHFKGPEFSVAQTENVDSSCTFRFAKGETYLFYSGFDKNNSQYVTPGLCSGTSRLEHRQGDLEYLRAVRDGRSTLWVWATISDFGFIFPQEGVRAEILGSRRLTGVSDKNGNLKIEVPKAGTYVARVYLPKGKSYSGAVRQDESLWRYSIKTIKKVKEEGRSRYVDFEVKVQPNKCGWVDLPLSDL